ncbi:MAG: PAS domain S-box protein, partial [Deltaproteobacteria bacterium]|nr:PAS domain S-box protein [Deltaproteobacteria bacterium]
MAKKPTYEELEQRNKELEKEFYKRKLVEEKLGESEAKYRSVFENTGTATVIIEEDTTISMANKEFEKLSGYFREEVEGKMKWTEFIVKEDLENLQAYHVKRRENGEKVPTEYEFRFVGRQGNIKDIYNKVALIPGTKRSVASLLDITERKQTEKGLQVSERKYRLLADNVSDVIWTMDMDFKHTYISPSIKKMTGYSVKERMAMPIEEIIAPESLEIAIKTLSEELALENMEQKDLTRSRTLELEQYCKDGSTFWAEQTTTFMRDQDGKAVGILGISRDITERKRAEKKIKEYSENLEGMVEERTSELNKALADTEQARDQIDGILKSVADGLIVTDMYNKVKLMNPEAENLLNVRFSSIFNRAI